MMINLNYQKRKNNELFKVLEENSYLSLKNVQNYISGIIVYNFLLN
jgi:hypothetical protein